MRLDRLIPILVVAVVALASACGDNDDSVRTASPTPAPTTATTCCPSTLTVRLGAPGTDIDIGTTGINYDFALLEGGAVELGLACPDADAAGCGVCTITGPSAEHRRCFDDVSRRCTTDAECAGGACVDLLVPPVPANAGGAPSCFLIEILDIEGGTFEPASGALTLPLSLRWTFFVGLDAAVPCPRCSGGALGTAGVCEGGPRDGAACTVDGREPLFGSVSWDCPPHPGANVGGFSLIAPLTTATSTLAPAAVCTSDVRGVACYCEGQVQPNACDELACRPTGDGDFACVDGPFDGYCTLEPYRGCKTDADCPRAADTCAFRIRPCLGASTATGVTEPLTLVGRAGIAEGELVAAHCLGAGTNAIGNAGLGLPAAAAWRLPYVLETSPTCRAP